MKKIEVKILFFGCASARAEVALHVFGDGALFRAGRDAGFASLFPKSSYEQLRDVCRPEPSLEPSNLWIISEPELAAPFGYDKICYPN